MNIHEYQAKSLLQKYGVAILNGAIAYTADEAVEGAKKIAGSVANPIWVVKSQIHAGGRGAGRFKDSDDKGGVRIAKSLDDVKAGANAMLGKTLVTKQTGAEGKQVNRLYIEQGCNIKRELYFSMVLDRATSCISIIASTEGGMNIEDVAHDSPEKILTIHINPITGISDYHARQVAFALQCTGDSLKACQKFVIACYKAFVALDASLLEVNPLVETADGAVVALDAKMNFDDNALYRHADIAGMLDPNEENEMELRAKEHELNYIRLSGNIGCMVNGAGLAMATMDIIQLKGGQPANFLDVGGGATTERVTEAFKLILSDPNVEGVLVNIFGGIMRCDVIAEGIITAAREVAIHVPLVVRLEGTNVDKGKELLANSGLPIITANNLEEAAEKIVSAAKQR